MESPGFQLEIPEFVVLILLVEENLKIREKKPTTQRYYLKFIKEKLLYTDRREEKGWKLEMRREILKNCKMMSVSIIRFYIQ